MVRITAFKYVFNKTFSRYAAIAWLAALLVMLIFYITESPRMVWIIFAAQSTLFKIGITWQLILYRKYKRFSLPQNRIQ
jgi:hypothetical protein